MNKYKNIYKKKLENKLNKNHFINSSNGKHIYHKKTYECGCGCDGNKYFIKGSGYINKDNKYVPNNKIKGGLVQILDNDHSNLTDEQIKDLLNDYNEIDKYFIEKNEEYLKGGSFNNDLLSFVNKGYKYYKDSQLYPEERHVPLYINGKFELGSFIGPHTRLLDRLRNGGKHADAKSYADLVSKLHDINYYLSKSSDNKEIQNQIIRDADNLMLEQIQRGKDNNYDNKLNLYLASGGISTKIKLEDYNIPYISSKLRNLSGNLAQIPDEDIQLLENAKQDTINKINEYN